jgi:cell division protein FtsW (lipid II flippase)
MEAILYFLGALAGSWLSISILIGIIVLVFFLRQRKGQELDIPPLDLVDAKKLDDMVAKQVEEYLRPLLESKGYQEEQIKEILTRASLKGKTFQR